MRSIHLPLLAFLALALPAGMAGAQDAASGERVFKSQCGICHAIAAGRNMVGPSLAGIVGRKAGTIPGFRYTDANKNSGLTWDAATLDRYLTNPRAAVPGTNMAFAGLKADQQRQDLVAYLTTLH